METMNLNEWLTLMIDEIRRKQNEEAEAERERARRVAAEAPPAERSPVSGPRDSAGQG